MKILRKYTLALAAVVMACMPLGAGAANNFTGGDIYTSGWTYFSNQRQITHNPYGIAFNKTDGPKMKMIWYGCGGWSGAGPEITLPNPDPTGYIQIGPGSLPDNLIFCIAALGEGNNSQDTFSGYLDWDGVDIQD